MVDGETVPAILSIFAVKNVGIESTQMAAVCRQTARAEYSANCAVSPSTSQPARLDRIEFSGTCDDRSVPHPGADSM